ncbi:MAG: hypothetical protein QM599_01680 [Pseudoxanthomonas sp.]
MKQHEVDGRAGPKPIRRFRPAGRATAFRLLAAALLVVSLPGCLVTPYRIMAPPVPVVKHKRVYQAYRILERGHDADGVETAEAVSCSIFASDRKALRSDWQGTRYGSAEFACLAARRQWVVHFRREGKQWRLPASEASSSQPLLDIPAAEPGQSAYILCLSSGSRLMSLNTSLNDSTATVDTQMRWCRDFVPPAAK